MEYSQGALKRDASKMTGQKQKLFFCNTNNKYYMLSDEQIKCASCGEEIELCQLFIIHRSFSKKSAVKNYIHNRTKCLKVARLIYDEFIVALLVENIPTNCTMVPDLIPDLKASSATATVFSAAVSNDGIKSDTSACVTVDHTRLVGRQSLDGARIGVDVHNLLEAKDIPILNDSEARSILEALRDAVPEIPYTEKKLIENKWVDED